MVPEFFSKCITSRYPFLSYTLSQVPHLTTKEVCKAIPKEICVMKLVNPHPVKKPIQLKWCTKRKPEPQLQSYAPPAGGYGAPPPPPPPPYAPPPSSYLPARHGNSTWISA